MYIFCYLCKICQCFTYKSYPWTAMPIFNIWYMIYCYLYVCFLVLLRNWIRLLLPLHATYILKHITTFIITFTRNKILLTLLLYSAFMFLGYCTSCILRNCWGKARGQTKHDISQISVFFFYFLTTTFTYSTHFPTSWKISLVVNLTIAGHLVRNPCIPLLDWTLYRTIPIADWRVRASWTKR